MRVLYRADGGHPIGTGHLFRAARLLRSLARHTALDALLLTADDPSVPRIMSGAPCRIELLPPRTDLVSVKPLLSAGPVVRALEQGAWDLVVVDMLDTPEPDMAAIARCGVPLLTLDDRGPGRLSADCIVNILVEEPAPDRLRPGARLLEGGPYAVLDPVFAELRSRPRPERAFGPLRRVLVAMGGADAAGLTVKVAQALCRVSELEEVQLVCGPAFPHRAALEQVLAGAPWRHRIAVGLPNLVEVYAWCDLAVVAGGLIMYEVCCTGTPALAVCQPIDHQLELSDRMAAQGAMATVGYGLDASVETIAHAVCALSPPTARRSMSQAGPAIVDGRGTERVAEAMIETAQARAGRQA